MSKVKKEKAISGDTLSRLNQCSHFHLCSILLLL